MKTPEFQGTHLWERLCWAKEKLEGIQTDIRVVYEDPEDMDNPAKYYAQILTGWLVPYRVVYCPQ